jgi:hypothetical protein
MAPHSYPDAIPLFEDPVPIEFEVTEWIDPTMTAYSPQISYIKHGSIRDNILNGLPLWPERYSAVLRQCALLPDLRLFDHGDLTEVGEQGVTLVRTAFAERTRATHRRFSPLCNQKSGGQRAR